MAFIFLLLIVCVNIIYYKWVARRLYCLFFKIKIVCFDAKTSLKVGRSVLYDCVLIAA